LPAPIPSHLRIEVLRRPVEFALAAVVAVMDQPGPWLALGDRHVEGVKDQLGAQVLGHRP
jgi:hypothetical protein